MSIRIGTGPNAWGVRRDPNQPDRVPWRRFLDEVVEAGYDWIEVGHYGYLPTDARTLRAELDSRGLNAIAATVTTVRRRLRPMFRQAIFRMLIEPSARRLLASSCPP